MAVTRGRNGVRQAVVQAIRASDLKPREKFRLRIALSMRPDAMLAVEDYICDICEQNNVAVARADDDGDVGATFDSGNLERILELILEALPQIIEIIKLFM